MLNRHIALLDILVRERHPLTTIELAHLLGFPVSTTYRLVSQLQQGHLLVRRGDGRYWLSLKLLSYGGSVIDYLNLRDVALPYMRELCQEAGETVFLTVADTDAGVFIEKVESSVHTLRVHLEIGRREPLFAGASMKILLAHLPQSQQRAVIERAKGYRLARGVRLDPIKLTEELERIRSNGWAASQEEMNDGEAGVSAAIRGRDGAVVAGLTISGAAVRFTPKRVLKLARLVLTAAERVSRDLGGALPT